MSPKNPLELVLIVTIGDLVQQGVTQEDMSVTGAMLAVGTIAVMDPVPRRREEKECLALKRLARQAAALLELRMLRCEQPADSRRN